MKFTGLSTLLASAAIALAGFNAQAEQPELYQPNAFSLDISVGANFDLSSLNDGQKDYFQTRKSTASQLDFRASYFFARHWGGYFDMRTSFFRLRKTPWYESLLTFGMDKFKPSFSLGAIYRYEHARWQLQPRAGLGFSSYSNRESNSKKTDIKRHEKFTSDALCLDAGVSLSYRTSRICALFVDAEFLQPLNAAKYSLVVTDENGVENRTEVKAGSYLRSMSLTFGIRFQCNSKKK